MEYQARTNSLRQSSSSSSCNRSSRWHSSSSSNRCNCQRCRLSTLKPSASCRYRMTSRSHRLRGRRLAPKTTETSNRTPRDRTRLPGEHRPELGRPSNRQRKKKRRPSNSQSIRNKTLEAWVADLQKVDVFEVDIEISIYSFTIKFYV